MNDSMYTEIILDLYKHPHNKGFLENKTHEAQKHNPLCGDSLTLQLEIKEGVIQDVMFEGSGCAISQASASLLTDVIKGKQIAELQKMTKDEAIALLEIPISPSREKCASLCYTVLQEIIENVRD